MIHDILKEKTKDFHRSVEHNMAALLADDISIERYQGIQKRFYGFYKPIESRLTEVSDWVDPELKIKDRMRLCLLASDLLSFNVDSAALSELPVCQNLPDLKTLPMVLGCLYVLEGSTLGGTIISKHLKKVLPIDESAGCSFFSSYGRDVGPMWSSFLAILSRHCEKFGDEEIVVKSACQTFAKMDCWLSNAG